MQPGAQGLLRPSCEILTDLTPDGFNVCQDLWVPALDRAEELTHGSLLRRHRSSGPLRQERELRTDRVVSRPRVDADELAEQVLSDDVLDRRPSLRLVARLLCLHRDARLREHDQELWRPEDPDPGRHVVGVLDDVLRDRVARLHGLGHGPEEAEDPRDDHATLVQRECRREQEPFQGVQQGGLLLLGLLLALVLLEDDLIEAGIGEPELRVAPVHFRDGAA